MRYRERRQQFGLFGSCNEAGRQVVMVDGYLAPRCSSSDLLGVRL